MKDEMLDKIAFCMTMMSYSAVTFLDSRRNCLKKSGLLHHDSLHVAYFQKQTVLEQS